MEKPHTQKQADELETSQFSEQAHRVARAIVDRKTPIFTINTPAMQRQILAPEQGIDPCPPLIHLPHSRFGNRSNRERKQ